MVEITRCLDCGKKLRVSHDLLGKKVRCSGCRHLFVATPDSVEPDSRHRPDPPYEDRTYHPEKRDNSRAITATLAALLGGVGVLLLAIGLCLTVSYFAIYDTSVPMHPGVPELARERVHTIDRMHDRQMGMWAGLGCLIVGVGFIAVATPFALSALKSRPISSDSRQ